MSETDSYHFPPAEQEFKGIGVDNVVVEGADGKGEKYPLEDFCATLPTAGELGRAYGWFRVVRLVVEELKHRHYYPRLAELNGWELGLSTLMKNGIKANCWTTALNYVLNTELAPYNRPLPYSLGITLMGALAYGLRVKFGLPEEYQRVPKDLPKGVTVHVPTDRLPITSKPFEYMGGRRRYVDGSIPERQVKELLATRTVVLVGANLLYVPESPWESLFVLRKRLIDSNSGEVRYTIPGGHAMSTRALRALDMDSININKGKKGKGYSLIDVPFLREAIEETGLPVEAFVTSRPHTIADQVMRTLGGEPVRYLAYIGKTILWQGFIEQLKDADGYGKWTTFGPWGDYDVGRHKLLGGFDLTPIAQIALRIYRE